MAGKGGKRLGAGRKPSTLKGIAQTNEAALKQADKIREIANDAVHIAGPSAEECKDMFIKSRDVLSQRYEDEQTARRSGRSKD